MHRRRRLVRGVGLLALGTAAVPVLLALRWIVFPPADRLPAHADVGVVLGPVTPQRMAAAERLLRTGRVGHLLISIPLAAREPGTPDARRWGDCGARPDTTCAVADPHTTRGEARLLRTEAERAGWTSAIVVTQTAHLERARLLFERCFPGRIAMLRSGEPAEGGWPYQIAYQTAATVKAWLLRSC